MPFATIIKPFVFATLALFAVASSPDDLQSEELGNGTVVGHDKFKFGTKSAQGNGATRLGRVSVFLDQPMEVHIRANTSVTSLRGRSDFTTGFSLGQLPQDLKRLDWSGAARFVTVPAAKTWVNCGSEFAVELKRGDHTIHWFAGSVKGEPVTFDAGAMSVQAFPLSNRSPSRTSKKLALLVGIDDYKAATVSDLRGCVNDVNDMEQLLKDRFEFEDEQVLKITNEQATRANIIQAFEQHLINKADSGTAVVFHYSGHGSQTTDINGDEGDGLDETIVPYDGRVRIGSKRVRDITDDAIHELFQQLSKKTEYVTFIFDSCHSGTVTKDLGAVARWAQPQDEKSDAFRNVIDRRSRDLPKSDPEARATSINDRTDDYVLISGCKPNELSYEMQIGNRRRGALTYHFTNVIRGSEADGLTYSDVMSRVSRNVTARFHRQHPQIEGANSNDVIFFVPSSSVPRHYVVSTGRDGINLSKGLLDGVTLGSVLDVYPENETEFGAKRKLGSIEIVATNPAAAAATQLSGRRLPDRSWGVLRTRSVVADLTPIHFYDPASTNSGSRNGELQNRAVSAPDDMNKVWELLQTKPAWQGNFRRVDRSSEAAIIVFKRERDGKIEITDGAETLNAIDLESDPDALTSQVPDKLVAWAKWNRVINLRNPTSDLNIEFDVLDSETEQPFTETPVLMDKESYKLRFANRSDQPLYISIVVCSNHGGIKMLYPGKKTVMSLKPGEDRIIQANAELDPSTALDRVVDHLKLFATSAKIDLQGIEQAGMRSRSPSFLSELIDGSKSKTDVPAYSWTTTTAVVEVQRIQ